MSPEELKALAVEREARAKAKGRSSSPMPNPWQSSSSSSGSSGKAPPAPGRRGSGIGELASAHRSVRIAHSLGLLVCFTALLLLLLVSNRSWGMVVMLAGSVLARAGGAFVHTWLPKLLQEGSAPTEAEVAAGATTGFFCLNGLMDPGKSLSQEWAALLENIAFACTYGKRNCLTSQMYSGELSLGKICSLVYGKLSEGVIRCN
eukprot:TRINITY_DN92347_c0_g1_i1.p1 TRINITY_DN92347_c0_g1~~TRINITY_DN92347_c0_g1_i1.p1  ORF type:complete len:215 (-),score=46.17 TRINITY_DN92347_c0_g1_i1:34-645(-)